MRFVSLAPLALALLASVGCSSGEGEDDVDEGAFSSNEAVLLEFEFDGELLTDSTWGKPVDDQLLYTVGELNGDNSVGRLDTVRISNVEQSQVDGKTHIRYRAVLQVAWGKPRSIPTEYTFTLPKSVGYAGQREFTERHKDTCVDWGAHDVDSGSMWYYYRPHARGCQLADDEVVKLNATVRRSAENTTGRYPEYHKIWEDNRLEVISIFGKYEDGATTASDAGISAYNQFVEMLRREFDAAKARVVVTPENVPRAPGVEVPDVTYEATLPDGKVVKVTALLVDNIGAATPAFDRRYEVLSPTADLIAYNGHAGLGQNVRALAQKGRWKTGQYQVFFMNGCDTFAYVDGTLAQTRAALNPDDPTGTKYMEFVTNAMPSFFSSMAEASRAMVKGFLSYQTPKTYEQIFEGIDRAEVVLVTGEEDNEFRPGMPIGTP